MHRYSLCVGATVLLTASAAHSGEIYKCKGKNGELVLTNMQCPDPKTTEHIGSYQAVRDNPTSQRQAAQRDERFANPAIQTGENNGDDEPELPARTTSTPRNDLSDHYRMRRDRLAPTDAPRAAGGGYSNDLSDSYQHKTYAPRPRQVPQDADSDVAPPRPPPASVTSFCNGTGTGDVFCHATDGSTSFGHADPAGNATMFGSDGKISQLHHQTGQPAQSTICVNGQGANCQ